ncbi:MAG: amidophosphoribosyltransferase [Chloroflexota bacterium]|nr:MAG: amidophosphoribosyltransferase [Chloroflexota bacterium]
MIDSPNEECGVFGIATPPTHQDIARLVFYGLYALQHRGQEAAGIAVSDGKTTHLHKGLGLVAQTFNEAIMAGMSGHLAIGHTRYSTTGSSTLANAQPFRIETRHGPLALAHNGNLVNASALRSELLDQGVGLTSTSDSEVLVLMLAAAPGKTWLERIAACMPRWKGAYSLVVLTREGVYAARDPWGVRPLTIGRLPDGGHAVASETGALEVIGCDAIREVRPGEAVALHEAALIVRQALPPSAPLALCTFEHIYFSRPDSLWDGQLVYDVRKRLGKMLAVEAPAQADVVIPVPDTSVPAAIGYAEESGLPFNEGLIQNRYIGRTFIQPSQAMRRAGVFLKFNPIPSVLNGRSVVVLDDSIVRGTTSAHLVSMLRQAGAREIHLRLTCPPIRHPCFMGVDMASYDELIAHRHSVDEIAQLLQVDSLHYLSLEGMMAAIGSSSGYCNACFTGEYPFALNPIFTKTGFEPNPE